MGRVGVLREQVLALKRQVLDDEIELVVRVLDPRNGDVSDLLSNLGEDDGTDIPPEIVLPGQLSLRVHQQVLHNLGPGIHVALIEWVRGKSLYPVLRLVEDQLTAVAVAFVEEVAGLVLEDDRGLLVVLRRENPAGLEKGLCKGEGQICVYSPEVTRSEESTYLANELVDPLEPRSELFVGPSVVHKFHDGLEESVKGTTVGKPLEEGAKLLPCLLDDRVIAEHALSGTSLLLAGGHGSTEVRLERVEEPEDRTLVRGVGLALGNDLDKE